MMNQIPQETFMGMLNSLAMCGAYGAVALAAIGSAVGTGLAGCAALGAWKRRYMANKPAPFALIIFAGAPLSQTIYAMILMMVIKGKITPEYTQMLFHMMLGIFAGIAFFFSAFFQGKAAAAACDAYGETEKGFGNIITVLGIVETVALFALIFALMVA